MAEPIAPCTPISLDAHQDCPWVTQKHGVFDLRKGADYSAISFGKMAQGGLQAAVFALYLSDRLQDQLGPEGSWGALWGQIEAIVGQDGCRIAEDTAQAKEILSEGGVPIFLGLEGGRLIQNDLRFLHKMRAVGVRYLTLTHNKNTDWADSATDVPKNGCLTVQGKAIVRSCNELGVIVDVSHASDETAFSAIRVSSKPVIASHSGCRALINNPRNLSNALIEAIAETGVVVHIPFARRFIGQDYRSVADHIDYAVQLVGAEHVGIGSDLDGAQMCEGIESVADWRKVVNERLSWRGYKDEDIAKIAGMNTLRVLG